MKTATTRIDAPSVPRKLLLVLPRLCLALVLAALWAPLHAQDEPIHMRPEFPLTFPLAQNGKDVSVKFPVMINPTTVLKPGMQLRVLYVLTNDSAAGSNDLILAHKGNMGQAYARDPSASSGQGPTLPPEVAHEIEGYRRTVWEVPNNFILAMAQYPTDTMHLIYSPTGKGRDMQDERFSFFDGLLVGSPNGKVTVIAVEKESYTAQAGIKAGDEIVSIGGNPTHDDLATFAAAYSSAKKVAKENEVASYPVIIRSPGAASPHEVDVPTPPKIKSGLMDGF